MYVVCDLHRAEETKSHLRGESGHFLTFIQKAILSISKNGYHFTPGGCCLLFWHIMGVGLGERI